MSCGQGNAQNRNASGNHAVFMTCQPHSSMTTPNSVITIATSLKKSFCPGQMPHEKNQMPQMVRKNPNQVDDEANSLWTADSAPSHQNSAELSPANAV